MLRKLATAASDQLGGDCGLHASLGQALLADLGFPCKWVAGYAAWRVGDGDGDVVGHTPHTEAHAPAEGPAYLYHAWLQTDTHVIDFTTYQLVLKAASLDAADGGTTSVDWAPDYLLLPFSRVKSYIEVAQAPHAGCAFYQRHPVVESTVKATHRVDPEDLALARLVLSNPDMHVQGPNTWGAPDL